MTMRYFEIRSPRADFTGKVGSVSFADGVARVQFDDTRDENGLSVAEEHQVSPGRSAVLFAQRRPGYTVVELGEDGKPLDAEREPAADTDEQEKPAAKTPPATTKGAGK